MRYFVILAVVLIVQGCRASNPLYIPDSDQGAMQFDLVSGSIDLTGSSVDLASTSTDLAKKDHPDMAGSVPDFSGTDLAGRMCFSGMCTQPNCGTHCCRSGEWCDNGTCRCGTGNACDGQQMCESGGPIIGNNQCGSICCGGLNHPCPL